MESLTAEANAQVGLRIVSARITLATDVIHASANSVAVPSPARIPGSPVQQLVVIKPYIVHAAAQQLRIEMEHLRMHEDVQELPHMPGRKILRDNRMHPQGLDTSGVRFTACGKVGVMDCLGGAKRPADLILSQHLGRRGCPSERRPVNEVGPPWGRANHAIVQHLGLLRGCCPEQAGLVRHHARQQCHTVTQELLTIKVFLDHPLAQQRSSTVITALRRIAPLFAPPRQRRVTVHHEFGA